jgi:ParB-like chromosome segregation protein Spo0J
MAEGIKVELWPVGRPIPYRKNPRIIPTRAIDKVAASIKEFGFRQPLVCDPQDVIIVGHTRFLAAKKLGLRQVPVTVAGDLSPAQAQAYRLADNRTNQEATWDPELLGDEFTDLDAFGLDLAVTGFDPTEFRERRDAAATLLATSFLVNPFSIVDCRKRKWRDRRKAWLEIGVDVGLAGSCTE